MNQERERMETAEVKLISLLDKMTGGRGMAAVRVAVEELVTASLAAGVAAERERQRFACPAHEVNP
jgi:hypothetical protein